MSKMLRSANLLAILLLGVAPRPPVLQFVRTKEQMREIVFDDACLADMDAFASGQQ